MSWSIQIAKILGIPIRLHLTFLLLIGWLGVLGVQSGSLTLFFLSVGVFACVLAHELGHSAVAQRYGVRVLDITLLPIGGLARMATIPKNPREEFWVAIAGPLVNFVLAPLFYAAHLIWEPAVAPLRLMDAPGALLGKLAYVNLMLGLSNLLPAFPMDGGRVFRALLARRMPYPRATQMAAQLGQLVAFFLGFLGLTGPNLMLTLIAIFIFMGASEEHLRVQTQSFVEGVPVREAMLTEFHTLTRGDQLGRAVDLLLAGTQQDFPVTDWVGSQQVVGVLTRRRLLEALAHGGRAVYVSEVMEPAPPPVPPDMALQEVMDRMAGEGATIVPVHTADRLCGLLTTENVSEYLLVRAALIQNPEAPPA